ncbi:hypothetical protein RV07_GL004408 [Enterococcus malodoratus]|nr:hypothetical protein RV07_GL004408 [Enterococcus malodoratus]
MLNEQMKQQDIYSEVYLIGGFAGRILLTEFRSTFDIDFILEEINDNQKLSIFNDLMAENNIEGVTVVEVPPLEEMEFSSKLEYSNLVVKIPTIEFYAITKIFSDRQKDEDDLVHQKIIAACDPEKLSQLIKLYKGDILNPDNANYNFHTLKDYLKKYNIEA